MVNLSYRYPDDIPVHFFGETQLPMTECVKKKRRYQSICFMIFYMLVRAEKETGKFTVTETCKYDRKRIQLSNNGRIVFEAIEDCLSEWVIRMTGNSDDILDFSTEYVFLLLHTSNLTYTEKEQHSEQ